MGVEGHLQQAKFLNDNLFLRLINVKPSKPRNNTEKLKGLGNIPLIQAVHRIQFLFVFFFKCPTQQGE